MSLLHSLVKAEALITLHWKSAWVPTPILVSASITRQCAVEPFTQRCQGQNTYQSALTVWLSSKIDTCFGRRNKTMCKWVSSTTHLRSQRTSQTALPACGFQNWLVLATNQPAKEWINKNICHRQAIRNREAGNVSKGTMNQNNSSFSAPNHSIAAYGLFPFIPLECWCKQTSKVTSARCQAIQCREAGVVFKGTWPKTSQAFLHWIAWWQHMFLPCWFLFTILQCWCWQAQRWQCSPTGWSSSDNKTNIHIWRFTWQTDDIL